jgi:hypothetical protein
VKYYLYKPDANNFAAVGTSTDDDDRVIDLHWTDDSAANAWASPTVFEFDEGPQRVGDFPSFSNFSSVPVFSERAWSALSPLIGNCCERLPLVHPSGAQYYFIHVMQTVDCLDLDRSELKRYSDGGVMRVVRYALKQEMLHGKHLFKLPQSAGGDLLLDDELRSAIVAAKLVGLTFKELPTT